MLNKIGTLNVDTMSDQKMSDLNERRKVDIVCSRPSKSSSEGEFKLLHHSADRKSN